THNLSVVEYIAQEIAVMYLGRIVEQGRVEEVMQNPKHPYTKALLSAVPSISRDGHQVIKLHGEMPSPSQPPTGCHFHPRCPEIMEQCRNTYPDVVPISNNHRANCFLYK
ncbi:MAG: ABC transporter ATP-binding protein, partial [Desulfobulbaceae bacterium]|nr:ABC transporter ATP-binding protein [Desulfobulbaceae bacterium]